MESFTIFDQKETELLVVKPYYWDTDDDTNTINCWSNDDLNTNYFLRISGFCTFCYLELPQIMNGKVHIWDDESILLIIEYLTMKLKFPLKYKLKYMQKGYSYYIQSDKSQMLKLKFSDWNSMDRCVNLLKQPLTASKIMGYENIKFNVYEDQIPVYRKFIDTIDIKSEYISIGAYKCPDESKISTIENEYIVEWKTMKKYQF
jgi:hypothetical protein